MEEPKMSFKGDQKPAAKKPVAKKVVAKKVIEKKAVAKKVAAPIMAPENEPVEPTYEMVWKGIAISETPQVATAIEGNIVVPCAGTIVDFYAVIATADTTGGKGTISIKADEVAVTGATITLTGNQAKNAKVSSPAFTAANYTASDELEIDLAVATSFAGSPLEVDIHVVMGGPEYDDVIGQMEILRTNNLAVCNYALVSLGLINENYMNWAMYNVNL